MFGACVRALVCDRPERRPRPVRQAHVRRSGL